MQYIYNHFHVAILIGIFKTNYLTLYKVGAHQTKDHFFRFVIEIRLVRIYNQLYAHTRKHNYVGYTACIIDLRQRCCKKNLLTQLSTTRR